MMITKDMKVDLARGTRTVQVPRLSLCFHRFLTGRPLPCNYNVLEFGFCAGICNRPRFQRGLALSRPCSPPSPLLWECGNPRLMRVSKRRGMSSLDLCTVDPALHFHSE